MSFNVNKLDESWQLLERHAARGDSWVSKAWSKVTNKDGVEAILCVPRNAASGSDLEPTFKSDLRPDDVLLFFTNASPEYVAVAFEIRAYGKKKKHTIVFNGSPLKYPHEITLKPALSIFFRRKPHRVPFFCALDASSEEDDRINVKTKILADHSISQSIMSAIRKTKTIPDGDEVLEAEVNS
jgi:hypothetical protein